MFLLFYIYIWLKPVIIIKYQFHYLNKSLLSITNIQLSLNVLSPFLIPKLIGISSDSQNIDVSNALISKLATSTQIIPMVNSNKALYKIMSILMTNY